MSYVLVHVFSSELVAVFAELQTARREKLKLRIGDGTQPVGCEAGTTNASSHQAASWSC